MIWFLMTLTISNLNMVISLYSLNFHANFESFKEMILTNQTYVDKSLLIDEILNHSGPVILITKPQNWGKSLNLDMIDKFFRIEVDQNGTELPDEMLLNRVLFTGGKINDSSKALIEFTTRLKISNVTSAMEHLGGYPVIFFRLGGFQVSRYHDVETELKSRIGRLFQEYRFVNENATESQRKILEKYLNDDFDDISRQELNSSLEILSELLFEHFHKKVFVLVDDYDDPINTAFREFACRVNEFKKVIELFRKILYNLFERNPYLEKGIITGRFVLSKFFPRKDCKISRYTLLDEPFSKFFGFTETDVDDILTKVHLNTSLMEMKMWYGGYRHGSLELFNPGSTMLCIRNYGEIAAYWNKAELTVPPPNNVISPNHVDKLVQGGSVTMSITKEIDYENACFAESLFAMCLFNGYLSPVFINRMPNRATDGNTIKLDLTIPNNEVKCIFLKSRLESVEMSWGE